LAQTSKTDANFRIHFQARVAQDFGMVAPGQKLGIPIHVRDQAKHFLGTEPD
jgi:hypothetical protein